MKTLNLGAGTLCSPVGGDLDYEDSDSRDQQEREPVTRSEQSEHDPDKYETGANPPQHADQGISLSL